MSRVTGLLTWNDSNGMTFQYVGSDMGDDGNQNREAMTILASDFKSSLDFT